MKNSTTAVNWLNSEKEAMRPRERILPSEWIQKRFKLPEDSAVKGNYNLDLTPQFRPVLDDLVNDSVDEIYLCSSAQSGKTTTVLGGVAYIVRQRQWSAMVILADENTSDEISTKRIAPAFERDEELSTLIDWKNWTKTTRGFMTGNSIMMAWASSVSQTASRSAGIVYADEIDKPGYYLATKEGDRLLYIKQRLETFPGAKFLGSSTPTDEDGNIMSIAKLPDVLVFDWHVPCPYCGQFQPLRFSKEYAHGFHKGQYRGDDGAMHSLGQVVWDGGKSATAIEVYATARYECGECRNKWTTAQKNEAVRHGKPVPRTEPHGQRKHYYHNNRLISLFPGGKLEKLVLEFVGILAIEKREERERILQAFVQSALAEPWKSVFGIRQESTILTLRDDRLPDLIPFGTLGLTGAIDTQDDGFYYLIRAWGYGLESWLIRFGFLETLDAVEKIIGGKYRDIDGQDYFINMTFIDSQGHRTSEVYEWCVGKQSIKPARGEQKKATPYSVTYLKTYPNSNRPLPGGLRLYSLNSTYYKDKLAGKLLISPADPGAFHMHSEVTSDYIAQMTAEFRNEKGIWECQQGKPNHAWDCEYMALAAADILGIENWAQQEETKQPNISTVTPPQVIRAQQETLRRRVINPWAGRR